MLTLAEVRLMLRQGVPLCRNEIYTLLQDCIKSEDISACRKVHSVMIFSGYELISALIDHSIRMFTLSGNLFEASLVFSRASNPTSHTWYAIVSSYFMLGAPKEGLSMYGDMQCEGMEPSQPLLLVMLKQCGNHRKLELGRILHNQIISSDIQIDLPLGSSLLDMYAKCGRLLDSRWVFDKTTSRDTIVWNAMINGYAKQEHALPALELFEEMQDAGIQPEPVTFSSVAKACSSLKDIQNGRQIHDLVNRSGLESHVIVGSALIDMYAKCQSLKEAEKVFRMLPTKNVVSWNAIIAGYALQGQSKDAINLISEMLSRSLKLDRVTFLSLLKAFNGQQDIDHARLVHEQIVEDGYDTDLAVGTTLVDMYAKLDFLEDAHKVFSSLPNRNIISWGAIISGNVQQGRGLPALHLYSILDQDNIKPDRAMLLCVIRACASAGAMEQGKLIHDQVVRNCLESDPRFCSALIDMYAHCGSLREASGVFVCLPKKDVVCWSVMIAAYARFGETVSARECLEQMRSQGLKLDHAIYTNLLTACSHAGDIQEGLTCFNYMKQDGLTPNSEQYNSMIVLLSHAGILREAGQLAQTMPLLADATEWTALLAASKAHGNMEIANQCFDQVVKLDSSVASGYALMASMYADSDMSDSATMMQSLKNCAGAWKKPGSAWIEVDAQMHSFIVNDESYPEISVKLENLKSLMRMNGYVPNGNSNEG